MNARRLTVILLIAALGGCSTASLGRVDADNAARERLRAPAQQGDADAQFRLGNSYCCGTGFYSTEEAIRWWCLAAAQGHELAAAKLREHASAQSTADCDVSDSAAGVT